MPSITGHDLFDINDTSLIGPKNNTNSFLHTENIQGGVKPIVYENFYGVAFFAVVLICINILVMIGVIKEHRQEISQILEDITEWIFLVLLARFERREITEGFENARQENIDEHFQEDFYYDNPAYVSDYDPTYEQFEEIDLNERVDTTHTCEPVKPKSSPLDKLINANKLNDDPKIYSFSSIMSTLVNKEKPKADVNDPSSQQRNVNSRGDCNLHGTRDFALHM